jgi:hypothetical protein
MAERSGAGFRRSGGSGDLLLEQDLLAGEPFELGHELALAAGGGESVVPVRAQVGEPGIGIGQQVPGDDQQRVSGPGNPRASPLVSAVRVDPG